jgi:nitroimidazol reductase NimA-like FMN-containing flavoprotein (pyridoxamine 5'-phosphate oxidase superfamily)
MTNDGIAREILDTNSYVVLATADADGVPWASPVWFAREDSELYWMSHPGARHSQNIAVRPRIAMVVFDSRVVPGSGQGESGQGVYMAATAEQLTDLDALESGMAVVSRKSVRDGAGEWGVDRVAAPARLRLYGAGVLQSWVLDADSPFRRVSVSGRDSHPKCRDRSRPGARPAAG